MKTHAAPPTAEAGDTDFTTRSKLDTLWTKSAHGWRRLLSRRMFQELRLRARFDLVPIARHQPTNTIPSGLVPDCARCQDICCRGLENTVSLRLVDIAALIDIGRTDVITTTKPVFPESVLRERPGLLDLVKTELWRTMPILRQVGDAHACIALTPNLKCSLYPHWPLSCARFPFVLRVHERDVVWGRRCQSQKRSLEFVHHGDALFRATRDAYDERIRDAVLVRHAWAELDALGIGKFLTR